MFINDNDYLDYTRYRHHMEAKARRRQRIAHIAVSALLIVLGLATIPLCEGDATAALIFFVIGGVNMMGGLE